MRSVQRSNIHIAKRDGGVYGTRSCCLRPTYTIYARRNRECGNRYERESRSNYECIDGCRYLCGQGIGSPSTPRTNLRHLRSLNPLPLTFTLKTFALFAFLFVVLWQCDVDARNLLDNPLSCRTRVSRRVDLNISQQPRRILLVPLLRKGSDSNENERWPEQPSAKIESFYRRMFNAEVVRLQEVRVWNDYYAHIDRLQQASARFDRVIFIGHGGFDGPSLNYQILRQHFKLEGDKGTLYRAIDAQPGILRELTISYDLPRNPAFHDYIAARWPTLLQLDRDAIDILKDMQTRLQPLDQACYRRHCSAAQLAAESSPQQREVMLKTCEFVCREPLFQFRVSDEISTEQFFLFAKSLQSLVTEDGLIMVGVCNPGSAAVKGETPWDTEGMLIHSTLTGGPHESYVHLLAAATGRIVAGPIGKTSAEDVVNRIKLLETNRPQRYLCIVPPPAQ